LNEEGTEETHAEVGYGILCVGRDSNRAFHTEYKFEAAVSELMRDMWMSMLKRSGIAWLMK
jgi:hypothetical protein